VHGVDLSFGHIVAPTLDKRKGAMLLEHSRCLFGMLSVGLLVGGRHRDDKSVYVGHGLDSFVSAF
jgi:hypothetical protein